MKIYIAHYERLSGRLNSLLRLLRDSGFDTDDVEVSTGLCRTKIVRQHFLDHTNLDTFRIKHIVSVLGAHPRHLTNLNPAYLANYMNHHDIWRKIACGDDELALVLEDDAVTVADCKSIWDTIMPSMPDDLDIAYLHPGCNQTPQMFNVNVRPDTFWYSMPLRKSRTCCTYLIRKRCASQMATVKSYTFPVDWDMSFLHNHFKHNVYWTSPCPFIEGSEGSNGAYPSTVR